MLIIWGDDIGTWNISHNSRGMMGYKTPNIDKIAKEGVSFTDYYGQQSCTAEEQHSLAAVFRKNRDDQSRNARRKRRMAKNRRYHCHGTQKPRIRNRQSLVKIIKATVMNTCQR
ncbi:sulfatase-like hydrolase/transferase [Chryseobacterium indoltheticum]|nr:sulfatase-like hydrolase/transferase [Chryseobacterium indoltheticum]